MNLTSWRAIALGAGLLLASALPALADVSITVEGAEQPGYARLVMKGASDLIAETRLSGDMLYIRFKEPVALDPQEIATSLADYVSGGTLSPGGSVLSLALKKEVLLNLSTLGDAAMIDLVDKGGEAAAGAVLLRTGQHEDFDRVVFDWKQSVDYKLTVTDTAAEVSFSQKAVPDFSRLFADMPRGVTGARSQTDADGTLKVIFSLAMPMRVVALRDGPRLIVDFHRDGTPVPVARADAAPAPAAPPPVSTPPVAAPAPVPAAAPDAGTAAVRLDVMNIPSGVRLRLPLAAPVPAAVFGRAGHLWIVLGGQVNVDLAALKTADPSLVHDGAATIEDGMTVLRIGMDPALQVIARRLNNSWEVDLALYPTAPTDPLQIARQKDEKLGPVVFVPTGEPPAILKLTDPEVGDRLAVVPLLGNGKGILDTRRYPGFTLLQTAQGVAAQLIGDGIDMARFGNGVALYGDKALTPVTAGPSTGAAGSAEAPRRIVDFEGWRRGPDSEFQAVRAALMERLAASTDSTRNDRRFDLATFYLAHGMAQESLGYLTLIAEKDKDRERDPQFLAVRGIAQFLAGRPELAEADLSNPALDSEPKIHLWLARVEAARKEWQGAYGHYRKGLGVLTQYPEEERAPFEIAGLKAARATGDMETAKRELMVLSQYHLSPPLASEVSLLAGELYGAEDKETESLTAYDKAIADDYRPTRVRAEFDKVSEQLKQKAISPDEAIATLERLRFVWRGDDLELKVLRLLGTLYAEKGDYRDALMRMRTAVTQFNGTDEARATAADMSALFRHLFLEGGTDKMPPIRALALYYDFRELTPIGYEGDQMIRRLADRLVNIDLLDKAEELLEHQVSYRLEGAAQAQVAENLAVVYLLDRKPDKALAAIEATEQPQLPEDITQRRRHLKAKALIGMKRYDDAVEALKGDDSAEATALRSDLYWEAKDWAQSAAASRALLATRDIPADHPTADDYGQILRLAVATSLSGDRTALQDVASRYHAVMAKGPYARTFDLITSDVKASGSELKEIIDSVADVSAYETYLASYRNELKAASATD